MNDTPRHILKKQFEIIHSRPLRERIETLFEMTELSRGIIMNQIHLRQPELNEIDLKIELFRTFYRFDFDKETLNRIAVQMKEFLLKEKKENESDNEA